MECKFRTFRPIPLRFSLDQPYRPCISNEDFKPDMLRSARRILIQTDAVESISVRIGADHVSRSHCDSCGGEGEMIDLNAAVTASGIRASELIRRIDSGGVHSPYTVTGHLLVCLTSLRKQPELKDRNYEIDID